MNHPKELQQLFQACDRTGKGFIVQEELQELCVSLGIANEDSDAIFHDLDHDADGKISFQDFAMGFREFFNPGADIHSKRRFSLKALQTGSDDEDVEEKEFKRRESVYQAWSNLKTNITDGNLATFTPENGDKIRALLEELEATSAPPEVAGKVSNVLTTLLGEINQLQQHHHSLEEMYKKEREHHTIALKSLEAELEEQVARVEQKARQKAREESEEEKRKLQDQMDVELQQLQAHLKIFQKVDSWLSKEGSADERIQEIRRKLEDAYQDNRGLKQSLTETTTNMGMLRSDLAQMRMSFEEKCRELHSEREATLEYMQQFDHMRRQLELLHEANKRLQDTNDSMRGAIEIDWKTSPFASRCSSARSSFRRERKRSHSRSRSPQVGMFLGSSTDSEGELKYGIKRLMDDLVLSGEGYRITSGSGPDSGLSTLPDTTEELQDDFNYNNETDGPMSLEEELDEAMSLKPENFKDHGIRRKVSSEMAVKGMALDLHGHKVASTSPSTHQGLVPSRNTVPVMITTTPASPVAPEPPPAILDLGGLSTRVAGSAAPEDRYIPYEPPDRTYKVVFAGDAAVGKSTFITRLCQNIFVNNIASTLGVDYKVKTLCVDDKNMAIQLWDTAGQERFRSITKTYFRRADGVLLLFDVTSERSYLNIRQWIQSIDDTCECRVPLVLCGNKCDLRATATAQGRICISEEDGEKLARECGASYFETSSKTGICVLDALVDLSKQMMTQEDVAVQTSILHVREPAENKSRCCSGTKKK